MDNLRQKTIQNEIRDFQLLAAEFWLRKSVLLFFIFALAEPFIDLETGLLRVRHRQRLELVRRTEVGKDFAHRFFAGRAMRERLGRERTVQREFPAADLAVALAQLVFVKRHKINFQGSR